jgi:hypothetical protein
VGGSILALEGVEAGQLGSTAGVKTRVVAGEDFCLEGELAIVRHRILMARENIGRIQETMGPLRGKVATLPEERKEAVRKLLEQLQRLERDLEAHQGEEEAIRQESLGRARHTILVRDTLYPDVYLQILGEPYRTRDRHSGPVKPLFSEGEVRLVPATSGTRVREETGT